MPHHLYWKASEVDTDCGGWGSTVKRWNFEQEEADSSVEEEVTVLAVVGKAW